MDVERAPRVARRLLLKESPAAILLPTDLVHAVYSPRGDPELSETDLVAKTALSDSKKIVFTESNLTWLVHRWPALPSLQSTLVPAHVFSLDVTEDVTHSDPHRISRVNPSLPLRAIPSRKLILREQKTDLWLKDAFPRFASAKGDAILHQGLLIHKAVDGVLFAKIESSLIQSS